MYDLSATDEFTYNFKHIIRQHIIVAINFNRQKYQIFICAFYVREDEYLCTRLPAPLHDRTNKYTQ